MPFAVGLWRAHPTRVCLQLATIAAFAQNANMFASRRSEEPKGGSAVTRMRVAAGLCRPTRLVADATDECPELRALLDGLL